MPKTPVLTNDPNALASKELSGRSCPKNTTAPSTPEYAVGIDAGGSYTDAVIVQLPDGRVLNFHKAFTTHADPVDGIREALTGLPPQTLAKAEFVSLATTFATNAIVEGKGARAGLILIGYDKDHPKLAGMSPVLHLAGGHDYWGEEHTPLDLSPLEQGLSDFAKDLDAIAVAGYFSVRNPAHELQVEKVVRRQTGLPVVCGHRLSARIDAPKRATTAWWNAKLIPLIKQLIASTRVAMTDAGLDVPLMIVRGDGTLLSAEAAMLRPVETILSGPAASILGARHLSGEENALVVDMGGTTTDMAILVNGKVKIDPEGASVGPWKTHVEAAQVKTVGLGGDSLFHSVNGTADSLGVGPRRVEPLCGLAARFPEIIDTLETLNKMGLRGSLRQTDPCSFYTAVDTPNPKNQKGSKFFGKQPVNEYFLISEHTQDINHRDIEQLELCGNITRASLTPTDLCVADGKLTLGDARASILGLTLFAKRLGMDKGHLAERLSTTLHQQLCLAAVTFLAGKDADAVVALAHRWFGGKHHSNGGQPSLRHDLCLTQPVIGTGAPASAWLPRAFSHLHGNCRLPHAYTVGTAVGAVVGTVDLTFSAEIHPVSANHFFLYAPTDRSEFDTLEEALTTARHKLSAIAKNRMAHNLVPEPLLSFSERRQAVDTPAGEIYLATKIRLRATGRIQL